MNSFYVYEWIRMDTKEPFYVGKGKNDRAYNTKKNKFFKDVMSYCNKNDIGVYVSMLSSELTEEEAFGIECWYIHTYTFDFGYSLTNFTWGGEGGNSFSLMSKEEQENYRKRMSDSLKGKNTGARSEVIKQKISETKKFLNQSVGKNNPMYGKSYMDYLTDEQKKDLSNKRSKIMSGKNNPMYGKKHSHDVRDRMGKPSRKVTVAQWNGKEVEFESRQQCIDYFKKNYNLSMGVIKYLIRSGSEFEPKKFEYHKPLKGLRINYRED